MTRKPQVEITNLSHHPSEMIGYAEGKWKGREFVASWATWDALGALFYDTWLDATATQCKAIAKALTARGAIPKVTV
jgi:hypothetical protein